MKTSCKGTQKSRNRLEESSSNNTEDWVSRMTEIVDHFESVLLTKQSKSMENSRFTTINNDRRNTQKKREFSYFYGKIKHLGDGVSTAHLYI